MDIHRRPSVMEGHGFYNQHSQQQAGAASLGYSALEAAAREVPLAPVVRMADFGSSQGRNSLEPVRRALATLRARQNDLLVEVTHTDLPQNDFNSLIQLVGGADGYLAGQTGVYASARGGSFYLQLFPEATLQLGWSSIATHWLSQAPGALHVIFSSLADVPDPLWKEQARRDWESWVTHRQVELVPGGQVVMVGSRADDHGLTGAEALMEVVQTCLAEVLPASELAGLCIPTYYRTRDEWLAPLGRGLRVREAHELELDDIYWHEFEQTGDRQRLADQVVGFWKAAFGPPLLGTLDVKDLYSRVRERLVADPQKARCQWKLMVLRLERTL